ncbi:superoxide dismutase family protein [Parvularcula sp. LCG005]|uniref:superoxide dismutase family protein n=1 Tax=Parvularcula sp. LCG005 TaxID=3078805 RepID=UPI002942CCD5|nr:superoxide dismutase family protein [Parvularcula sp. LCG005]WOI54703.1 superoxide dismutase family protein [Parvularcula sp. LCG005]
MKQLFCTIPAVLALVACGGSNAADEKTMDHHGDHAASLTAPPAGSDADVAVIGTDGSEIGRAIVAGGPNGLLIRVDVSGLSEGFHGIHLHQVGDCSDFAEGFKLSGSHINPDGNAHGLMNADGYEKADLPNVYAHHSGHARAELFVGGLMLEDAMDEDGFALVVHENEDDHQTQPIGGAGARKGCAAFK